ncbi:carbohydrate ABC transporter permease [Actinophytocola sp. NPDC049390]|uniref:carbohydrate ABC transporter permease n=1 Tax=Actinophytocola sp. NPDC049390 TaxID=3363894 RepID=UPI0037B249FB
MTILTPARPTTRVAKGLVLTVCCLVVVLPFLAVISTSLADERQVAGAGGYVLWPDRPSFYAYEAIFEGGVVTRALLVSVGVTVVGAALSLLCTALLAYGLSRPGSFGSRPILMVVLFSVLFSPGIIPMYLTVKQLGLLDSYWALILSALVNGFNVIVMRAFFLELPQELLDAAKIDGASELTVLFRIVLPLSKAVVAVIGLFYAVAYWNNFFSALLYITDNAKYPLSLVLRTYVVDNATIGTGDASQVPPQQSLQMAMLVVSIVPILLVYPFLQKHFAKGIMIGAVKG